MKVKVSDFAERQINATADSIEQSSGKASKKKFRQRIRHAISLLRQHPNMGPAEPFLSDEPIKYRSIVVTSLNKLIYTIGDDLIEIVDFWDVRREPAALADEVINEANK